MIQATMRPTDCYINAGVYLLDVYHYHTSAITRKIEELIDIRAHHDKLWRKGVHQPSFILGKYGIELLILLMRFLS